MRTDHFDYCLPEELIAQHPAQPRESCRLLVIDRASGTLEHRRFTDVLEFLHADDLLVVNDTKVMPARLKGKRAETESPAEILLLHRLQARECQGVPDQYWEALVKPGRRLRPGSCVVLDGMKVEIVDWALNEGRGQRIVKLSPTGIKSLEEALNEQGTLPLPPYIKSYTGDTALYQTVYAREQNSAAAPTAGLHFSEALLEKATDKGVTIATVCLEIGLDTFRSVEEEFIADHRIHSERYTVPRQTREAVEQTKERGGRVIAVGTTAVRALESSAQYLEDDTASMRHSLREVSGEHTSLYITPGHEFKVIDSLITNFHSPRSTLLMLVAAFAGYETMMQAYRQAVTNRYRFLSFGDAMLIL